MDYSDALLGQYAARRLRERTSTPVLVIGGDYFTRADLAAVECFNYLAASHLTAALKPFGVKSTKQLFDTVAPADVALPRVGVIALAVLGAAFEAKGLGGDAPLDAWAKRHAAKDAAIVTFGSLKHAVAKREPRRSRKRR